MPSKPPFDPQLHLLDPDNKQNVRSSAEVNDEVLARMLQDQIIEEERRNLNENTNRQHQRQETADMELARRIQYEESGQDARRDLEARQRDAGIQDQLEFARRMQQQALSDVQNKCAREARRNDTNTYSTGTALLCDNDNSEDSDLLLARRMQELEQMGMGRMNSDRRMSLDGSFRRSASMRFRRSTSADQTTQDMRLRQEEEDARLALMIAESGDSLRSFEQPIHPLTSLEHEYQDSTLPSFDHTPATPPPFVVPPVNTPGFGNYYQRPVVSPFPPNRDPPGVELPPDPFDMNSINPSLSSSKDRNKKRSGLLGFVKKNKGWSPAPPAIPAPIPPPPQRKPGPLPYSVTASREVPVPIATSASSKKKGISIPTRSPKQARCSSCAKPTSSFLVALDKKYHPECFRCMACHTIIDSTGPFAYTVDDTGEKHPLHRKCYSELYGVKCAVCKQSIPAGPDGKVSFVKHPFFDTEQMCPRHASNPGRRCTGCHRFEPEGEPFADLNDSGRCVCYSCCRTVIVDSVDTEPLWAQVIFFFEHRLKLPIWPDLRKVPILVVGYDALNDQLTQSGGAHGGSSQIMTRGLCLTEHQSGRKLKLSSLKFNRHSSSFEACDVEEKGFTFFQVPDANKVNPDASVTCILCLSGLPKDLTASVLAHEATHAWIKLHPRFDIAYPIPPQVEEGCAQLVAMLFLNDGLEPASNETYGDMGPSEEKLRQYFKFSIETDDNEIYGDGYRKAAKAYADIGIEALMSHVVFYKDFPRT